MNPPTPQKARDRALHFLSYRPRSIEETKQFLKLKSYPNNVIANTISELTDTGLLNDQQFTQWWVQSRSRSKPSGPLKLKSELKQKGIDSSLIEQFTKIDYTKLAQKALRNQANKLTEKNPVKRKQKLIAFLRRRGFTWNQINAALTQHQD